MSGGGIVRGQLWNAGHLLIEFERDSDGLGLDVLRFVAFEGGESELLHEARSDCAESIFARLSVTFDEASDALQAVDETKLELAKLGNELRESSKTAPELLAIAHRRIADLIGKL